VLRNLIAVAALLGLAIPCLALRAEKADDDPFKKLGAFVGKWQSEGILPGGGKIESELECRWSPRNRYLICNQQVHQGAAVNEQLTVYGYEPVGGKYYYSTFQEKNFGPSTGMLEIEKNLWTYSSSFERNGKKSEIRITNEFTDPKTEVFKVALTDDSGATWKTILQGTARKTAD